MRLHYQIFPPWHIYLDVFLIGVGLYIYFRVTKKINTKINETINTFINNIFLTSLAFADESQREIENEAINHVIKKE